MRKTTIAAGFLVFLTAGLLFGVLTRTPAARIEIAPETVDLGKVGTGRLYSGTFVVENKGRGPLIVELLKVSCACTVTEMCESPIASRRRGTITAYISVSNSEGPFGSTLTLRTNDPRRPQIVLGIRGTAETVMQAAPQSLLFGDIAVGDLPRTREFVVRPGRLATPNMLARLKATCKDRYVQVQTQSKGEDVAVLVTLSKDAPLGAVRSSIVLAVDDFNNYGITVPVVGCVTGDYQIRPTCLFYGRVAQGAAVERECRITPLAEEEMVELVDKGPSHGGSLDVDCECREGQGVVKAVLRGGLKAGTYEHVLTLRVRRKDREQPQYLQVPIIYVVADSNDSAAAKR